jgi:hypothetical protein
MNLLKIERERQEEINMQKKLEISNISNKIDLMRNEQAEIRAEDLADTFLRNKQMRVRHFDFNNSIFICIGNLNKLFVV